MSLWKILEEYQKDKDETIRYQNIKIEHLELENAELKKKVFLHELKIEIPDASCESECESEKEYHTVQDMMKDRKKVRPKLWRNKLSLDARGFFRNPYD